MLPPAFKMRLSKHPPSESNICTQNRPFPPGVLPLLAPISSQEARSSHAFCFWLPHGYYKYIYIQYILYICMIYMFVYCSTCLQSPSSATTPRSDSLEGDRSPSVKKKTAVWILNGVLKSSSMLNSWLKNIDCTVEFIERSRFSQNCTCEPMNMRNQLWMWLAKIGLAASAMIIFLFLMQ